MPIERDTSEPQRFHTQDEVETLGSLRKGGTVIVKREYRNKLLRAGISQDYIDRFKVKGKVRRIVVSVKYDWTSVEVEFPGSSRCWFYPDALQPSRP